MFWPPILPWALSHRSNVPLGTAVIWGPVSVVSLKRLNKYIGGKVVFMRKLQRGGSEHSFGIHVARLAGMPKSIVERATHVLHLLEASNRRDDIGKEITSPAVEGGMQLSFFQLDDPVLSQIRDEILTLDINNLTPMAALNKLHDIRSIITGKA